MRKSHGKGLVRMSRVSGTFDENGAISNTFFSEITDLAI